MRARNRLALAAAGALCLIATVYVTATRRSAVEARLRALLAAQLRAPCVFESAEFSFLGGFTITGLRVLDPEDPLRPPLVEVGEARLDFNLDLLGRGPHVTLVQLRRPVVRVTADRDGRLLLLQVAAPPEAGQPTPVLPVIRIFDGTVVLDGPPTLPVGDGAVLTSIRADVISEDGRVAVRSGHARGAALGPLDFTVDLGGDGRSITATVRASEIDAREFREHARLEAVTRVLERLDVVGRASADIVLDIEGGAVTGSRVELRIEDAAATVTLTDEPQWTPPEPFRVALRETHITFVNGHVEVERARGEALGAAFEVSGSADIGRVLGIGADVAPALDVTLRVTGAHVGPELEAYVPEYLRRIRQAFSLVGGTDAEFHIRGPLEEPSVDGTLGVRGISAAYAGYVDDETGERHGFPWKVDDLQGTVTVAGARVSFDARGRHGAASVAVSGFHDSTPENGPRTSVTIAATDVPLDAALGRAFGDREDATLGPWRPEGVAARIDVIVTEDPAVAGGEVGTDVVALLDGRAGFTPDVFPVPLQGTRGTLRILEPEVDGRRVSRVVLEGIGAAGDGFRIVAVDGVIEGHDEDLRIAIDVERLSGPFRAGVLGSDALPENTKDAVRRLAPTGSAALEARLRSANGERDDVVTATLRGTGVRGWGDVPLAADALVGRIRYEDDTLVAEDVRGTVLGGAVLRLRGSLANLSADTPEPRLEIAAEGLPLGDELRDGLGTLARDAAAAWDELAPAPDARADVSLTVRPPGDPAGELTLRLRDLRGGVRLLGLPIDVEIADVTYDRGVVSGSLRGVRAGGEIASEAFTYDTHSGDLDAEVSARGLAFPSDLVPLLPAEASATIAKTLRPALLHVPRLMLRWDAAARTLSAAGAVALRDARSAAPDDGLHVRTSIAIEELTVTLPEDAPATMAGRVELRETSLDPGVAITELAGAAAIEGTFGGDDDAFAVDIASGRARVSGLLLEDLSLRLEVEGARIRIPDITAEIYGGKLTGRFNRGGERLVHRGAFDVVDADLAQYARDQQREVMAGTVNGGLRFRDPGGPGSTLEGSGHVELSGAEIRLPWISAALRAIDDALFGIAAIEGNFHAGNMKFDLRGRRVLIRELHFEGPSVPLLLGATLELQDGRGAIELDGNRIDLVVYPRMKLGVLGLDPTGIFDRVVGLAQFMVRRLRIEGTTRNPRARWELIGGDLDEEFRRRPRPIGDVRRSGPEPW